MLRLHTLGAVYVTGDGQQPMTGAASQRRLLALLAILGSAGDAGVTRDRLVAILWPDVETENGRHSLTQALYQARRALHCDDLFVGGAADVRLNPDRIATDVRDFELAAQAGDLANAISQYRGEFLADLVLPGNSEFDRWADGQRQRWRGLVAHALERLAADASAAGDHARLVELRQRIAALDALNSRAALRLVESLRDAGNIAGALRQLQLHEALLRAELDIGLPPDFDKVRDSLRDASRPSPVAPPRDSSPTEIDDEPTDAAQLPRGDGQHRVRGRRLWRAGVGVAIAAAGLAFLLVYKPSGERTLPRFDRQVLVAPFRTVGADESLAFLRAGLVELISMRLAGDSAAGAADPGTVLRAWRQHDALDSADVLDGDLVRLAERLGARAVITGSVVGNPRHLVISARIVDISDSGKRVTTSVAGPLDSLTHLVDRLSGRLLIASAGETERFRRAVPPSLPGLRAFLDGLSSYRSGDYAAAVRHFDAAIRSDTTFALGAMYLALASDKRNSYEQNDRALSLAWANQSQLAPRDRLLLTAFAGPRYPAASAASEQIAAWEAAVAWAPGRTDALVEYAELLMRSGRLLGAADPAEDAGKLLRHVLRIDPQNSHAEELLLSLALRTGGESLPTLVGLKELPVWARWSIATRAGDMRTLSGIRDDMPTLDDADLTAIARLGQLRAEGMQDIERALRIKRSRAQRQIEQLDAILAQHSLALNQGRPVLALELTGQLEAAQPGWRAHLRLRVLDALYGGGDSAAAVRAASLLAGYVDAPAPSTPTARAAQLADACVLGQWRLETGETSGLARTIATLRSAGVPRVPVPIGANPHTCADLIEAAVAVQSHSGTATSKLAAVDSLVLAGPGAGDAGTYAHILIARLYEELGRPDRALIAIRRRPHVAGWPRYLATARVEEGRLALLTGDAGGGIASYQKYLALRDAPEPPASGEVARVRAAVRAAKRGTR